MTEKILCDKKQLTLYHYQELTTDESRQLEQHLGQCAACQTTLKQIRAGLASLPEAKLKIAAAEKLCFSEQVLSKTKAPRSWRKPVWGSALAATGALGLALLIMPTAEEPVDSSNAALADIEVLEQLELLQDYEILQDLDLLEELEDLG